MRPDRVRRVPERSTPWGIGTVATGSVAGLLIAAVEVIVATSFAGLVFVGPLSGHLPAGVGMALIGASAILVTTSLLSSIPTTIGSTQDGPAAILALVAAAVAAETAGSGAATLATVVVAVAAAALVTGSCFLALGTFGLGKLVRFLPYPVVGGFLAGTGWLVARGAVEMLFGGPPGPSGPLAADLAPVWIPGTVFALALLLLTRRYRGAWVVPATVIGGLVLFYAALPLGGMNVTDAEAAGWLLGPFPAGALWPSSPFTLLADVQWGALVAQVPNLLSLVAVAVIGMLLNTTAIELDADREDLDLDHELRTSGFANLAAGATGGFPGFHALSLTALAHRTGAQDRTAGLVAGAAVLAVLALGGEAIGNLPTAVVGGVLLFLGLGFLVEWLVDARAQLSRSAYLIVVLIVVVIATVGFVEGVVVGVGAALALFAHRYSRADVVKHQFSLASYRSKVDRPLHHREVLRAHGDIVHIMELQNFLFFGTAATLVERIRERVEDPTLPKLEYLVLGLRRVPAVDASAAMSLSKAQRLTARRDISVVFTGLSPEIEGVLVRAGIDQGSAPHVRVEPDLDRGVEWCEDQLLRSLSVPALEQRVPFADRMHAAGAERAHLEGLRPHLERIELRPGEELFVEGTTGGDVYYLESGRLTVVLAVGGASMRLRTMLAGTFVGELGFYLGVARTATVLAETPAEVVRLPRETLDGLERTQPDLAAALHRSFARLLAERLTDSLRTIEALLR